MDTNRLIASAIMAVVAMPSLASAARGPAPVPTFSSEKCFGIAAAGANDCGTATHSCAGESTKARDPASWLYLPAGTCTRIEGGSLTAKG
jgi:uncharacterized membrane protein